MLNAVSIHRHVGTDAPETSIGPARSIALNQEKNIVAKPHFPNQHKQGKIALPTMEGLIFEKIKHIAYLEASGNYTVLHFIDKRQTLVCKTLREVESMLPEDGFTRIHRSHSIHLKHLKKYVKGKGGHVMLQNGVLLSVSTGQKDFFMEHLRQYYGC